MFNYKIHDSINEKIKILIKLFPPEITDIIIYYIIKLQTINLKNSIYFSALNFKNIRDRQLQNYQTILDYNIEIQNYNNTNMYNAFIANGLDPNNPLYIPVFRQKAIRRPLKPWWMRNNFKLLES